MVESHKKRVSEHPIHNLLEEYLKCIGNAMAVENISESVLEELDRSMIIANIVKVYVDNDSRYISLRIIDKLYSYISTLISYTSSFISSKNEDYINSLLSVNDDILEIISHINLSNEDAYRIVDNYTDKIQLVISKMVTQQNCTNAANIELENKIKDQQIVIEKMKSDLEQHTNNFKKENENRLQRLESDINSFKSTLDNDLASQKRRNEEVMQQSRDSYNEKMKSTLEQFESDRGVFLKDTEAIVESYNRRLEEIIETAQEIVGQVNTTMFSYKYKQVADDAKDRTITWNGVGFCCITVALVLAWYTLSFISDNANSANFTFSVIARGMMITIAMAASVYCFKEASKHGRVERYARKIEMELIAFDTFVQNIPEAERFSLKQEVVKRIFINRDDMIVDNNCRDKNFIEDIVIGILNKINIPSDKN